VKAIAVNEFGGRRALDCTVTDGSRAAFGDPVALL